MRHDDRLDGPSGKVRMPVTYRIDKALHLVYVRWEGSVTTGEATEHATALRTDPDFAPDMAQLSHACKVRMELGCRRAIC